LEVWQTHDEEETVRLLVMLVGVMGVMGCTDKGEPEDSSTTDTETLTTDTTPTDTTEPTDDTEDTEDTTPPKDTAPPPDPETVPLAGSCSLETDLGGFVVEVFEDDSNVAGTVLEGVVPSSILEFVQAEGDCALYRQLTPFCNPSCDAGYTCDFDKECIPYPQSQDLGTVSLDGLTQPLEMEPVTPGYTYFDTSLKHPIFNPGGLITLDMPAGTYGPATLYGVGVEPLSGIAALWEIDDGVDTTITWDAPTSSTSRSEMYVTINIDQHGASPASMYCIFEDDGSGVIPGSLVSTMIASGVTGFPTGAATRRTVDSVALSAGCMDLEVASPRRTEVDVLNFTPCLVDEDCPDGQECNFKLQICE